MKTLFTILLACFCLLTAAQSMPLHAKGRHTVATVQQHEQEVHCISDAEYVELDDLEPTPQACETLMEFSTIVPEVVTPYHQHGEFLGSLLLNTERYILVRSLLI